MSEVRHAWWHKVEKTPKKGDCYTDPQDNKRYRDVTITKKCTVKECKWGGVELKRERC